MSVVIESLEGRSLFSASPALVELRADVTTFKAQLVAVKKALTAEVKVLTADLKRDKAATVSKALLTKSLASSVALPEAQLTRSLGTLLSKASAFVSADTVYLRKITDATTLRYSKTLAAEEAAFGSENTLASELYSQRLDTLATTGISLATATADATTEVDANTLTTAVSSDNSAFATSQATITLDVAALGGVQER